MPNALIKKISEQTGRKPSKLESAYQKLEREAAENKNIKNKYAFATGILTKQTGYKKEK